MAFASPRHSCTLDDDSTWRELTNSSWRDDDYRRMVMAFLVEAVYVMEVERQERRKVRGIAERWWKPFQYRLAHELVDERDGSIFGAVFERDHLLDGGAPGAIVAFRGTLLRAPTFLRDVEDEFRLLARNSLKGSARLTGALGALKSTVDRFGGGNVCLCGHSLGAGVARQAGNVLMAMQAVPLEFHLFNAPYVSLPVGLRRVVKTAACLSKMLRSRLAPVGRWHVIECLKNVAYANCILGYTRLECSTKIST